MRAVALALLSALGVACFVDEASTSGEGSSSSSSSSSTSTSTTAAETSSASAGPVCGDGQIEGEELCDDGPANGEGGTCTELCVFNVCGDGVRGADEACDDGNEAIYDGCTPECALEVCGDGVVQPNEACDDGNLRSGDGCSSACALESCGDGVVQRGEVCDDGNAIEDDACTSLCKPPTCGDGIVSTGNGEGCDEGPANADDAACTAGCQVAICGDGLVGPGEACDDGDDEAGDGCAPTCERDALRVFLTQSTSTGVLGGLRGADALCAEEAAMAGLSGTYYAWLGVGDVGPEQRLTVTTLPLIRTDLVQVATSLDALTLSGALMAPIDVDPFGMKIDGPAACDETSSVWTNVKTDGKADGNNDCMGWTTLGPYQMGRVGRFTSVEADWTKGCPNRPCSRLLRLYCFEG
ncbi:MAG: DUF4215 domain-containing protein [Nannocystaceae bacterium]